MALLMKLTGVVEKVSRWMAWVGGVMILLSSLIIFVDVILRKLFNFSIGGADELSGYALGISVTWALSFALVHRANVRIDALYHLFPKRVGALLDILSLLFLGAFVAVVARFAFTTLSETISFGSTANTPLQTPLVIPQGLWFAGFVVFLAVLLVYLVTSIAAFIRGDLDGVQRLCGVKSISEEIDEEVSDEIRDVIHQER
ncbi:MAG: TRAP transporter small permease [Candidatus Sedimenticola sp. 6PFRAG7]